MGGKGLIALALLLAALLISGCNGIADEVGLDEQVEIVDQYVVTVRCIETGESIEGAVVNFSGNTGITDREGAARFENVEAGIYGVDITAGGFVDYNNNNIVVSKDNNQSMIRLVRSRKYKIIYHFISGASQIWSPVPVNWDGHGTVDCELVEIKPEPSSLYTDEHGNLIAYWNNGSGTSRKYSIEYIIEINKIRHVLTDYSVDYDQGSDIYQTYTAAERYTQSDDPMIVSLAEEIIDGEVDPVEKAKKIASWVRLNIASGDAPYGWLPDSISVLQYKKGHCGAFANMFVALCRAVGVPARNISIFHNPFGDELQSGMHSETYYGHIIAEFYLEDYGWVQVETSSGQVGSVNYDLLILAKGNTFPLEKSSFGSKHLWFHLPMRGVNGQIENAYLDVERLN